LIYHVINRGNNRRSVFHADGDYLAFLKALADLKQRKPFELYGCCLMSNHIHLLPRPRQGSISRIVQSLLDRKRGPDKPPNLGGMGISRRGGRFPRWPVQGRALSGSPDAIRLDEQI
jgi:hypothetical protein